LGAGASDAKSSVASLFALLDRAGTPSISQESGESAVFFVRGVIGASLAAREVAVEASIR
jgi:hypothetical protein